MWSIWLGKEHWCSLVVRKTFRMRGVENRFAKLCVSLLCKVNGGMVSTKQFTISYSKQVVIRGALLQLVSFGRLFGHCIPNLDDNNAESLVNEFIVNKLEVNKYQ